MLESMGRMLLLFGLVIAFVGLILIFAPKIPLIGKLPGDIHIQRGGFSCFFPLATSILLSILLTIILNVVIRLLSR